LHGNGIAEFPDGRKYEGGWEEGKRFGFGMMYYPNGDVYEGEYRNDR